MSNFYFTFIIIDDVFDIMYSRFMITKEQTRAARAHLGWNQQDLADRSGISKPTIANYENGMREPEAKTLEKITAALERAGIAFTENNGIQLLTVSATILDEYTDVLEDALNVLNEGDEILFHCADDSRSSAKVITLMKELRQKGVKTRSTICEGNTYILGNLAEYRWIDRDYFANSQVWAIYANRMVAHTVDTTSSGKDVDKYFFIRSQSYADRMRKEFEFFWRTGKNVEQKS